MSRSYRRTPIFGIASAPSEKADKQRANRTLRRKNRQIMHLAPLDKDGGPVPYLLLEVSDPWLMAKDGRRFWIDAEEEDMRK